MKTLIISCLLLCAALSTPAFATRTAREDHKLVEMVEQLNQADGYTYQVVISSVIVDNPKETSLMRMTNYQSRKTFVVYSKTDEMMLFICDNGQFRVNYKDKTIYYAAFPKDPAALQQQKDKLLAHFDSYSVQSFLLDNASVSGITSGKKNVVYKLTYPASSMIKNLAIDYDPGAAFFNSIIYTIEKPIAGSESLTTSQPSVIRQTVVMDHYVKSVPGIVTQLIDGTKDLQSYLESNYKGYQLKKLSL